MKVGNISHVHALRVCDFTQCHFRYNQAGLHRLMLLKGIPLTDPLFCVVDD